MSIDLKVPEGFPPKYRKAIIKAMDQCVVKKHILEPPEFEMSVLEPSGPDSAKPFLRSNRIQMCHGSCRTHFTLNGRGR